MVVTLPHTWGWGLYIPFYSNFTFTVRTVYLIIGEYFSLFSLQTLIEDEPEKYQTHFSLYAKKGIDADNIEELYKKVHAAIRADPTVKKSEKPQPKEHKRYAC